MSFVERVLAEMKGLRFVLAVMCALLLLVASAPAQETTGGLEGTVTDPSGAVVPGAHISLTGTTLVGTKEGSTDSSGYYRFANLPPGTYTVKVTAKGFETLEQSLEIEVGHIPTLKLQLQIGSTTSTVEVTGAAPVIDVTSDQNITNVTSAELDNMPHGVSFQSVIQFAPMARNEPLGGFRSALGMASGGTGGSTPGSTGNGLNFGYSIGGAADSESSYLVEGQDTEQLSGGYSKANVPFEFIDQVEMKTSGIEAEYGGALGGVVNVVMKKGSNGYHGALFTTFEPQWLDANNNGVYLRYSQEAGAPACPLTGGKPTMATCFDPPSELYNPKRDTFDNVQPGFTLGGPIIKDRIWFFAGFAPEYNKLDKRVDFTNSPANPGAGVELFTQNVWTYYTTARLDAAVTQKIRLYASWLYQYARENGDSLPVSDPEGEPGFVNTSIFSPLSAFAPTLGWSAPNSTYNFGADITLTPRIVATTRFGYFFENYHDFGWQTTTPNLQWNSAGAVGLKDNKGNALPANLQMGGNATTAPYVSTFTPFNSNKHDQFNQDVAFFWSGWGSHNFKVGYQLNRLENTISQNGNVPLAFVTAGGGLPYSPSTATGVTNCKALKTEWGVCAGQYGYLTVQDFATVLSAPAVDWNHALYAQDSWTVGHGLTFNLGLRVEKESLPAPGGVNVPGINFSWTDKVAPRLGVAWDPTRTGKMKLFFSYGVVNDVMKLLVAQTSFGAQAYEDCTYALGPDGTPAGFSVSDIDLVFKNGRACPSGPATLGANFANGTTPPGLTDAGTGISLIENVNFRPAEPVAPGVKPYRQHEYVVGWDYEISKDLAFEARYDRRRLDHVIEDASLADPSVGELYTIVNPGEGVDKTLDGYASFLQSLGQAFLVPGYSFNSSGTFGTCPTCPPNPKPVRDYDGIEMRLTKNMSHNWTGMFSYTWSSLWGNYTGLTTTDQNDGDAPGRDSPDTSRAFDEPFFYYGANGKSNNGPLPTDRPNTFKGNAYYQLPWKGMKTTFGIFQYAYQGTPMSSYTDLAAAFFGIPYESTYLFGRGQWAPITQDAFGNMTFGTPYARRTPWYTQTDFNAGHQFDVAEGKSLRFDISIFNLWNQHSVVQYYEGFNSINSETPLSPNGVTLSDGALLYQTLEEGYNPQAWVSAPGSAKACNGVACTLPLTVKSSQYGQPVQYQLLRNMRLGLTFTF